MEPGEAPMEDGQLGSRSVPGRVAAAGRSGLLSGQTARNPSMLPNRLRALLNAGEPAIGTGLLSGWPALAAPTGDPSDPLTGEASQ